MVFDVSQIEGIGEFALKVEPDRELYLKDGRTFLVFQGERITEYG